MFDVYYLITPLAVAMLYASCAPNNIFTASFMMLAIHLMMMTSSLPPGSFHFTGANSPPIL